MAAPVPPAATVADDEPDPDGDERPPSTPDEPAAGKGGLLVVLGAALVGLLLIVGYVVYDQSKNDTSTASSASADGGAATNDTADPALGERFVVIIAPANDATRYYLAACGCPDSYNTTAALGALPTLVATKQQEATQLHALALDAPPAAADDIENLARLETAVVTTGQQLTTNGQAPAAGAPTADLTLFKQLVTDLDTARQAAEVVRIDLGVTPGQLQRTSATTTTTTGEEHS